MEQAVFKYTGPDPRINIGEVFELNMLTVVTDPDVIKTARERDDFYEENPPPEVARKAEARKVAAAKELGRAEAPAVKAPKRKRAKKAAPRPAEAAKPEPPVTAPAAVHPQPAPSERFEPSFNQPARSPFDER